ncbi:MAG: transglutaminase domain-containing protein [Rhodomicrobium sp.]|nr:transglutaminase domain-containing protein [Rhodomicrobium sp.]
MNRRQFLIAGGTFMSAALTYGRAFGQERFITGQAPWRKFDIVTRIAFGPTVGRLQAWVPVPSVNNEDWSKALGSDWKTNAKTAQLEKDRSSGAEFVRFEWPAGEAAPVAEVSSHAETRDRLTDFTKPQKTEPLTDGEKRYYTTPTALVPHTDELGQLAAKIVENAKTDLGKAKAIYEWIVEERSCGLASPGSLLTPPRIGDASWPNCSALNCLYAGLARISGLPVREIYGYRIAPSQFGYQSLGAFPGDITARVHIRAEVWLDDYGWVPVDPGDVRRVLSDEPPGNLQLTDPKAVAARVTLFGGWEGNWVPYNMAHDLVLPSSEGLGVPFLVWPIVRVDGKGVLDPESGAFSYKVRAKELPA